MNPQIIKYNIEGNEVTLLEDSSTFLIKASSLQWGVGAWPPVIFLSGLTEQKSKFDYYKAYKNVDQKIMHCEYRNSDTGYKLIIHND